MKRKFKNKKVLLIIIATILLVLITALLFILTKKETNKAPENQKSEIETSTTTTTKAVQIVNEESKSRPYAIMVNNVDGARKLQSGLQDAYIVYEMMVEGGITRYLALFLDQNTERIGSIRSARHYYLDYALENDAIYVHHGYSPQAQSDWKTLGVDRIEVSESLTGWRDKTVSKTYEYTLFTNIEKLSKGIGSKRTTRNKELLLNYSVDSLNLKDIDNSKEANEVYIKYSNTTRNNYVYDRENKVYLRSVKDKEQTDYVTGKQLTVKNIIVYDVKYKTIPGDTSGRQDIENIGTGSGYYISEGIAIPITWEKKSRSSATIYKTLDGKELIVNDGNTFIQIMPSSGVLEIK